MMIKIQLLAIILAIFISVGYAKDPKKIVNGQDASILEVPHQVSLQEADGFHFCGGSIIDPQLILTAAHCVIDEDGGPKKEDIYVVIGTRDNKLTSPDNVYRVVRRVRHNFQPGYYSQNDIAVLKLERPIFPAGFAAPGKLPSRDVQIGTPVMASGWGATAYNIATGESFRYPRYLKKYYGTVISQQKCRAAMEKTNAIGPEHICIETTNGADTCEGDSGGPLTYNGEIIGIHSFGIGCGLSYPAIFTSVHYHLQWIGVVQWAMFHNSQLPPLPEFVEA